MQQPVGAQEQAEAMAGVREARQAVERRVVGLGAAILAGVPSAVLAPVGLVAGASEIVALVWLALTGALKPAPEAPQGEASSEALYFAPGE